MAERRSLLSSTTERGALVSGGKLDPPLLPYERQLIQTLGISEQEYRLRLRLLYAKASRAPGYELIPDIQNAPIVPVLVNIAIGVALTAISTLLAPKPKKPEKPQERDSLELPNETGRSRFNQTRGFQGAPPLARLGSRIPYIFGKMDNIPSMEGDEGEKVTTGGIIAEPVLLWSRMESNGSFQTFKLLTSIGLGRMDENIDEANVLIAGKSISSYFESNVLLHHRKGGGTVSKDDIVYGDSKIAGGNSYDNIPYGCPDGERVYRSNTSFCQAYSPSGSNTFGVSRAIRNGGRYSLNWELIAIPRLKNQKDDPNETLKRKRHKIAGRDARYGGMPGIGRWYNPLIGITKFEGKSGTETDNFTIKKAAIGDEVTYTCGGYRYNNVDHVGLRQEDGDQTVKIGDLNSAVNTLRQEADNLMQEGEVLLSNDVLLQVISRPKGIWQEGKQTDYKLKIVGFNGPNKTIGVAGSRYIQARGNNIDLLVTHEGGNDGKQAFGTKWFALMKVDYALANNTRACDVTEIGIRSQVYNQANGLCNFPEILSPNELESLEQGGTSISSPTQTKYMFRTSFFQIYARNLKRKSLDNFDGYEPLEPIFAVSGNEPIDLFNSIRVVHPETASYSYKFCPISADAVEDRSSSVIYSLRAKTETRTVETTTKDGTFKVIFMAAVESIDELTNLPEMRSRHKGFNEVTVNFSGVNFNGYDHSNSTKVFQTNQAFFEDLLGQIKPTSFRKESSRVGEKGSAVFTATKRTNAGTVTARIKVTSKVVRHNSEKAFGTNKKWTVGGASFQLLDLNLPSGYDDEYGPDDFDVEYECNKLKTRTWYAAGENPTNYSFDKRTYTFRITGGKVVQGRGKGGFERQWDAATRIKEAPTYSEMTNSSQSGPEHSIAYINEIVTNPTRPTYEHMDLLGIQMRSMNSNLSVSQISVWLEEGIIMERLEGGGTFGPSHNFASILHWLLVHPLYGIGRDLNSRRISPYQPDGKTAQHRSPLVDTDSFVVAAKFMEKMPFRFDGAISGEINLRSWATEQAQAFMCNMVMKNGRFCLQPVVPVNKNGDIQKNVPIQALFTEGNILEDSFEMEYLPLSDRRNFEAVIKYRDMTKNTLANERTVLVRYKEDDGEDLPQEDYDYTGFCTSYEHAVTAAKYLLSLRRRVDHVIKFRTIPQGLQIAPGDFIKVQTDLNPYTNVKAGSINKEGAITSIHDIQDGVYEISVYVNGAEDVATKTMTVKNKKVLEPELYESLFAVPNIQNTFGVYMIEEISFDEDGIVDVVASNHATTGGTGNDLSSKMVEDLTDKNRWTIKTS